MEPKKAPPVYYRIMTTLAEYAESGRQKKLEFDHPANKLTLQQAIDMKAKIEKERIEDIRKGLVTVSYVLDHDNNRPEPATSQIEKLAVENATMRAQLDSMESMLRHLTENNKQLARAGTPIKPEPITEPKLDQANKEEEIRKKLAEEFSKTGQKER